MYAIRFDRKRCCVGCTNCSLFMPKVVNYRRDVEVLSIADYALYQDEIHRAISQCFLDAITLECLDGQEGGLATRQTIFKVSDTHAPVPTPEEEPICVILTQRDYAAARARAEHLEVVGDKAGEEYAALIDAILEYEEYRYEESAGG